MHHQEQLYIEPQGMVAWWTRSGVHITGSPQCPYYVHKAMKRAFGRDGERVHVTQAVTGGGFGGKEEYPRRARDARGPPPRKARPPGAA